MSTEAIASELSNARLGQQIQTAVLKKSLEAAKQQGAAAIKLIASAAAISEKAVSAPPSPGTTLDVKG